MGSWVLNSWYVAAWSGEVNQHKCLARTLLGRPMVFFRCADGAVAALDDRCPHRFAPLSEGRISGDGLQCAYHGLTFDRSGRCVRNPQGSPPAAARVAAYQVAEKHGMVWVWPGDADKADPASIPTYPLRSDPGYRSINGLTHVQASFQLVLDNLLDLTHIAYLHPGFGGDDWQPNNEVILTQHSVSSVYTILGFQANDHSKTYFPDLPERFDERDTMTWYPASICRFDILLAEMGGLEQSQCRIEDAHILTPETLSTTHYFWSTTFSRQTPTADANIVALLNRAFEHEDKPMLEKIQKAMGSQDFWSLKPVLLKGDNAAVRVRRALDKLAAGESSAQ